MIEKCNQISETKMNNIKGNQVKTNKKGIEHRVVIYGLKQCRHCHKLWSRDFNTALNIGYAFVSINMNGIGPTYLTKLNLGEYDREL